MNKNQRPSPIGKHVLDATIIPRQDILLNLLLGQPFVIGEMLCVGPEIGLTGQNAALEEESLLACNKLLGDLVRLGRLECIGVVADWVETDEPGVHVDAGGFGEGTFCCLRVVINSVFPFCRSRVNVRSANSPPSRRRNWEISSSLPWSALAGIMFAEVVCSSLCDRFSYPLL